MREAVVDFVFEIFIKSANYAYDKRKNSISIFKVNLQDIGERNARGILICLYRYRRYFNFFKYFRLRDIVKSLQPDYGKVKSSSAMQVITGIGKTKNNEL